jgi:hypothetical protein
MSSFFPFRPSPSKDADSWDTINAGQLYRLYPNKPTARQNVSQTPKRNTSPALAQGNSIRDGHND